MTDQTVVQAYNEDQQDGEEEKRREVLARKPGVFTDSRRLPSDLSLLDALDLRKPWHSIPRVN
jgi:hypothetical protein